MNSTETVCSARSVELAVPSVCGNSSLPSTMLTREAWTYAIHRIFERAGVAKELSRTWRFEIENDWATICLEPDRSKKITFPMRPRSGSAHSRLSGETCRAAWAYPPARPFGDSIPDFVIPFVGQKQANRTAPIFSITSPGTIRFQFDLPAAALLTLARVEESAATERDGHERFPASASIAVKQGFLQRPIVDEYGFAFEQALRVLLSSWAPERKPLRVKLTHDVDEVGIPFSLPSTFGHTFRRRKPKATLQDLLSTVTDRRPAFLESVLQLAELSHKHGLDSSFYWKASSRGKNDSGYDLQHDKVKRTMHWLKEHGFENGVHPGYESFQSPERLRSEVATLRQQIGNHKLGGRQHFLRWNPETWRHWEACELAYDSSVGFAEQIGFRAGTCMPYRPWLWDENREANLLEIPLLVMDRTLGYYMRLSPQESLGRVLDCVEKCRTVGGVFTILWHNDALLDPVYGDLYLSLLERLSGSPRFDWSAFC